MELIYYIGEKYKYPLSQKEFILLSVSDCKTVFVFNNNHTVTNNVFIDMIRVKTGVQVYQDKQPTLFEVEAIQPLYFCKNCLFREPWQCGSKVIQYCNFTKSNRTTNGLLKIKTTTPACKFYAPKTGLL